MVKRIAIAGHKGFIGSSLNASLAKLGITASTIEGKIRDSDTAETLVEGCDLLYICAGVTGGAGFLASYPRAMVGPNVNLHLLLFDACVAQGVKKVIALSSTTGYPDRDHPLREMEYFEGELHSQYFAPGHARRFIERLAPMYPELEITFIRPTVVYGPGDDYNLETSHVIPALVRKVAERQDPITLWGGGNEWRDAVYIDDVVQALILAESVPGWQFNLATGSGMTVAETLHTLARYAGYDPAIKCDMTKPSMLKKRELDTSRARTMLKWEPKIKMEEGLLKTLRAYENGR